MRRRTRIAECVYADASGVAATVKVRGVQKEKRFDPDTPLDEIRIWQDDTRAQLRRELPPAPEPTARPRATLLRDIVRYLKQLRGRPSYASDRSHLKAWTTLFPLKRRRQVTTADVNLAIATWRTAGVKDKTILHRCRVWRELCHALDGPRARTAVDDAKKPKTPHPHPVGVLPSVIRAVARQLKNKKRPADYARYLVQVTCGQRPAQLMRATRADVQLTRRIWIVRAAKGAPAHTVYLNAEQVAAWKGFIKAGAWGHFETTAFAKLLRACGWPAGVRPYNARHSVAIDALRRGADLGQVQALLGHTSIETTRRNYAPVLLEEQRRISRHLQGRLKIK